MKKRLTMLVDFDIKKFYNGKIQGHIGRLIIRRAHIHIFVSTDHENNGFQQKLIMQHTNKYMNMSPLIINLSMPLVKLKTMVGEPQ